MVNIEEFIKRLELLFDYYGLSASSFADKIGVQRSSLSHLLSGRNKPSLDFILKIIEVFPEVDLYWILNGRGNFPKNDKLESAAPLLSGAEKLPQTKTELQQDLFSVETIPGKIDVFENSKEKISNTRNFTELNHSSEIEKIVVFYKNGTFKSYSPE